MSARRLHALASLVLLAAAFATRAAQSLDYDELFTVWVASRPLRDLIHQANVDGFTPPLFYALVKLLSIAGLANEDLRVLPAIFASLAAYLGLHASERLFGSGSRWRALSLICGSAYLFTFAQELRPYSALLACAFYFLGQLGGPPSGKSDTQAAVAALVATLFSYLGATLVVVWILECGRRRSRAQLALVSLAALGLCAAGLQKAFVLAGARVESRLEWIDSWPSPTAFFGLAPTPSGGRMEVASLILLAGLMVAMWRARAVPSLAFIARAFAICTASVIALDAVVPIGFAPRYLALPMAALLLLIAGTLPRLGRAGSVAALLLLGANGFAVYRYLTVEPPAREDWRGAMTRLEARLGSEGVLIAFPFHHAAVAAHAYAPRLTLAGGYTSKTGPVFWYEPPAAFAGYEFAGLTRLNDSSEALRRLSAATDVCVLSDEPDVGKTASVFAAFQSLGGTEPLLTGDPRLRALCRPKG